MRCLGQLGMVPPVACIPHGTTGAWRGINEGRLTTRTSAASAASAPGEPHRGELHRAEYFRDLPDPVARPLLPEIGVGEDRGLEGFTLVVTDIELDRRSYGRRVSERLISQV